MILEGMASVMGLVNLRNYDKKPVISWQATICVSSSSLLKAECNVTKRPLLRD